MRKLIPLLLLILSLPYAVQAQTSTSIPAHELEARLANQWMQLLYDRVNSEARNVPQASRIYAYAGIAMYEAVLPGIEGAVSLGGRLNDMPALPTPDPHLRYDWLTVMNGAVRVVINDLLSPQRNRGTVDTITGFNTAEANATIRAVDALYQNQLRERLRAADRATIDRSLEYGETVGRVIADWAAADGFAETRTMTYTPPQGDGAWTATTLGQTAMEPYWGLLRPFTLSDADACFVPLNVPFDSDTDSTFHMQAMEVWNMGDDLTDEQREIARFWDERVGESGTASGHWLHVQNQLIDYLDLKLGHAVEMYALVGVTMADAFISAWSAKYRVNLLRPETYINTYIDPLWEPLRQTPPFPAYPSGHAVLGGAVAEVLTEMFDPIAFTDRYGIQYGMRMRVYTSFEAAAYENALSRLYAGVHYRTDMENGLRQGECVGQAVIERLMESA